MVFLLKESRKALGLERTESDEEAERAWEKTQDWSNPFDDATESESREKKDRKKKKKKRSKKKHYTEEELSEMSSQADTLLDDLLGVDDEFAPKKTMLPVDEESDELGCDDEPLEGVSNQKGINPFDEPTEEPQVIHGEEIDMKSYKELLSDKSVENGSSNSPNPFGDATVTSTRKEQQDEESDADDEASLVPDVPDDDSTIPPPEGHESFEPTNPFDDSIAESAEIAHDDVDDQEEEKHIEVGERPLSVSFNAAKRGCEVDATEDAEENNSAAGSEENGENTNDEASQVSEESDIVESSKRLLRMADKRLQYQQHNDEVKKLRVQLDTMRMQSEAMSEQLRRAVETKCDLVLAQTEMERCHEQDLIAKDDEISDLRVYAKDLMEQQAVNELNFMNEISALSQKMKDMAASHKTEIMEKDFQIAQLEMKITSMKTESVKGKSARSTFKSRFLDSTTFSGHAEQVIAPVVNCA